jgi:hypothetical protein
MTVPVADVRPPNRPIRISIREDPVFQRTCGSELFKQSRVVDVCGGWVCRFLAMGTC